MGLQGPGQFSGGPHSAVNDAGPSPYTGGARVPAGTPTDVGAGGFTHLKASAPPPILNTAGINMARHSRSANQRVVYARVVQMHNQWATKVPHTNKWSLSGPKEAFEYDQLQAFELAWSYRGSDPTNGIDLGKVVATEEKSLRDPDGTAVVDASKTQPGTYGHMTPRGFKGQGPGAGIERMLRLAATPWVEEVFENHIGRQKIALHQVPITKRGSNPYDKTYYDSEIYFFDRILSDARERNASIPTLDTADISVLHVPDVSQLLGGSGSGVGQGLNVLEDGCFLISKFLSGDTGEISFKRVKQNSHGDEVNVVESMVVPKNLGGKLAQRALVVELRCRGLLSWQPDGICLSKFESSDSVAQNAAYDAQMSQLFNVAVQGPSITNVWTFDSDMVTTPGDKVFMLLVGTVRLGLVTPPALKQQEDENLFRSMLRQICESKKTTDIINGDCTLSDFRLMRATSSYLVEHSLPNVNDTKSRCGLADNNFNSQSAFKEGHGIAREYILGGWCIGTVMDSAASRAVSHNMPHASQHTMAINVNVNIEWWDADQLHLAYQNKGIGGNNIIRTRLEAAHYKELPRHVVRNDITESFDNAPDNAPDDDMTDIEQLQKAINTFDEEQAKMEQSLQEMEQAASQAEQSDEEREKFEALRTSKRKAIEMVLAAKARARLQLEILQLEAQASEEMAVEKLAETKAILSTMSRTLLGVEETLTEMVDEVITKQDTYDQAATQLKDLDALYKRLDPSASEDEKAVIAKQLQQKKDELNENIRPDVVDALKPLISRQREVLARDLARGYARLKAQLLKAQRAEALRGA